MSQKILEQFAVYHDENPQIWKEFQRRTFALLKKSHRHHLGAQMIMEVIRYFSLIEGNDEYKINNNYSGYYARLFMETYPEYQGLFETRYNGVDHILITEFLIDEQNKKSRAGETLPDTDTWVLQPR